jgi:hypothetical protein
MNLDKIIIEENEISDEIINLNSISDISKESYLKNILSLDLIF